jgi:hypothetical protein
MSQGPETPPEQQTAPTPQPMPPLPPEQQAVYVQTRGNGMATTGFVTGLLGAIFSLIPFLFFVGFPLSVCGVVFSIIGLRRVKADPLRGGKGLAIAGLVLGIVGILLTILWVAAIGDALNDLE